MSDAVRIVDGHRSDATPEAELDTLAAVYGFILDCHAKKKAAERPVPDGPDDAEDLKHDRTATSSIFESR